MSKIKSLELKSGRPPQKIYFAMFTIYITSVVHHCSLNVFMDTQKKSDTEVCTSVEQPVVQTTDNTCCTVYQNLGTLVFAYVFWFLYVSTTILSVKDKRVQYFKCFCTLYCKLMSLNVICVYLNGPVFLVCIVSE